MLKWGWKEDLSTKNFVSSENIFPKLRQNKTFSDKWKIGDAIILQHTL